MSAFGMNSVPLRLRGHSICKGFGGFDDLHALTVGYFGRRRLDFPVSKRCIWREF